VGVLATRNLARELTENREPLIIIMVLFEVVKQR